MKTGVTLRVARPTDRLSELAEMYVNGIGFVVLDHFENHAGFDGVILGHPRASYHLEFTSERDRHREILPMKEHLLAFYVPNSIEWEQTCADLLSAGFRHVPSHNPYWDIRGRTFEDPHGFRVVLQNTGWRRSRYGD